jgi:undecaprenyl phosphate N,N'-diacetylbacillosamine 1-phosphate transferase
MKQSAKKKYKFSITSWNKYQRIYINFIKQFLDFIFALFLLFLLWPVMILISIVIKLEDSQGSIFFIQDRVGRNNEIFKILKFRSMKTNTQINYKKTGQSKIILKSGKIIRNLSLDELPQLINVIKGEMSFIGPRPLHVNYLPYYSKRENTRHIVKPGMSGWAQVNGRNNLSWDEKFYRDLEYVKRISFMFDIKILCLTFLKIFNANDVVTGDKNSEVNLINYKIAKEGHKTKFK